MKETSTVLADSYHAEDVDWRDRSEYWVNYRPIKRGRKKKYSYREPLILVGHGVGINVHHNTLLIRPGLTHYPQKREEIRFFLGDPNLPDRIIILDASGTITFDAINWMADQKIGFIQLDWKGRVAFTGNAGLSANPELVKWQAKIRGTPKALELNRRIICAKLDASTETIKSIFGADENAKIAIAKIRALKSSILALPPKSSELKLLGYEGVSAAIYYRLWHGLPLQWTKLSKRPIPADWHKIGSRNMAFRSESSHARHPVNAMLNYGYAVLITGFQ